MGIVADKLSCIKPSQTKAMTQKAEDLAAAGQSIIALSQGEPDFDTPEHIKEAAIQAIRAGYTKYTAVPGIAPLKKAIIKKFKDDNEIEYSMDEVTSGTGAKQLLFNAFIASINEGDEVICPTPCWVSYPEMIKLAGGVPIEVPTLVEQDFILQPEQLEAAITPKTKWLLLNSPSNPTGNIYSREDLLNLAKVLRRHPHVWIMSDDIYEYLIYDNKKFFTMAQVAPDLKDRTLTINGVSKAFSMTGWRVGFAGGPKTLITAMNTIQGQSTSHVCSIAQHATIAALNGSRDFLVDFLSNFVRRRDLVLEQLSTISRIQCRKPHGAFYVFFDCRALMNTKTPQNKLIENDMDLAMYFLEVGGVALVPGSSFMCDGFMRMSYAASEKDLLEACARLKRCIEALV